MTLTEFFEEFTVKNSIIFHVKEYTSSVSPEFLNNFLAPTLHTRIYWVQANIMSIGKTDAWLQLPVITLAKPRKQLSNESYATWLFDSEKKAVKMNQTHHK